MLQKSKPSFPQKGAGSVQDIQVFITTHIHRSPRHNHGDSGLRGRESDVWVPCVTPVRAGFQSVFFPSHIKSFSSASRAAAISSASELLPSSSSSLESLNDSSAESRPSCLLSTSASSSSSPASSYFRF